MLEIKVVILHRMAIADLTEKITLEQKFEETKGFYQAGIWINFFREDKRANVNKIPEVGICQCLIKPV